MVFDVLSYSKVTAVPKITNCLCSTDFYHGKVSSEIDLEQFCKNRENERKSYFKGGFKAISVVAPRRTDQRGIAPSRDSTQAHSRSAAQIEVHIIIVIMQLLAASLGMYTVSRPKHTYTQNVQPFFF